jgi:hypothetical protein
MNPISTITSKGGMQFVMKETGGANASVFNEFLERLLVGARRLIYLIVDRGPAHLAKKTRAIVETLAGRLKLSMPATSFAGSRSRRTDAETSEGRHGRSYGRDGQSRLQEQNRLVNA